MTAIDYIFVNSFILGVLVILVFYFLHKVFGFYIFRISSDQNMKNTSNPSTHCVDKDCVRCTKYNKVLDVAAARINSLDSDDDIVIRLKESLIKGIDYIHENQIEQNPNVFYNKSLCGKYFWDVESLTEEITDDIKEIEHSCELILREFKSVYNTQYLHFWKRNSTDSGLWDVFHLVNQGTLVEDNASLCPQTTHLINRLSSCMRGNVFGNILFSVVKPATVIEPHYGPTNVRLRCHLGLITTDECILNVGTEQQTWQNKECIVFDDSFLHSVHHHGSEKSSHDIDRTNFDGSLLQAGDRAVLIIDIWHPEIPHEERDILNYLFSLQNV